MLNTISCLKPLTSFIRKLIKIKLKKDYRGLFKRMFSRLFISIQFQFPWKAKHSFLHEHIKQRSKVHSEIMELAPWKELGNKIFVIYFCLHNIRRVKEITNKPKFKLMQYISDISK